MKVPFFTTFLFLVLFIPGCTDDTTRPVEHCIEDTIESLCHEFKVNSCSYFISDKNQILENNYQNVIFEEADKVISTSLANQSLTAAEVGISDKSATSPKDFLENIFKLSSYFDQQNVTGYMPAGNEIKELNPVWFIHNKEAIGGYQVFCINRHVVLWNCFPGKEQLFLYLKFIDLEISVGLLVPVGAYPTPVDYGRMDLLQSPWNIAILQSAFQSQASSQYPSLHIKELASRIAFFENLGNTARADSLKEVYTQLYPFALPVEYINKPCVAEINYVGDEANISRSFSFRKPASVFIQAVAQVKSFEGTRKSDAAEVYLYNWEMKKRFYFHFPYQNRIRTQTLPSSTVEYEIEDSGDTAYIVKAKIPWRELLMSKPHTGTQFPFEVLIIDTDCPENVVKSIRSWSIEEQVDWGNHLKYGTLILSDISSGVTSTAPSRLYSIPHDSLGHCWNRTTPQPLMKCTQPPVFNNAYDHSGHIQTAWDDESLYVRVKVLDNIRNSYDVLATDVCWIENAQTGQVVWRFINDDTNPYFPVCVSKSSIMLPAGEYTVHYASDEKHSFGGRWLSRTAPTIDDYGIRIYETDK